MSRAASVAPPAAARAGFVTAYGHAPVGVWSAPGRVNLIGEHTDYNEGFVLPFAIDRRTHVAIGERADRLARVASTLAPDTVTVPLGEIASGMPSGWSAYALGTAWGLGQVGADLGAAAGFDAYVVSDVPSGSGLSSSAALECALAVGLQEIWGLDVTRDDLVTAAHLAENEIVGAPTGVLDQSAALLAGADAALFLDCRDRTHQQVPLRLEAAGIAVLVVDTRVSHAHAEGEYAARRESCARAARALGVRGLRDVDPSGLDRAARTLDVETFRRARHVVTENRRVLETVAVLRGRGPRSIGELLLASHASMRDDFEISTPQLDLAVETAVAAGAIGARMTGGGFGGSAIALVDASAVSTVSAAVVEAFARRGYAEPAVFEVRPSAAAVREPV